MEPAWVIFGFAALLAVGWASINGCHRRNPANKQRLTESVSRFPQFTTRKLLRLLAPTSFKDRWNHVVVIAGCVCIIGAPVALFAPLMVPVSWLASVLSLLAGSLVGSLIGEFALNSWGCGLVLPPEATPPARESADEPAH